MGRGFSNSCPCGVLFFLATRTFYWLFTFFHSGIKFFVASVLQEDVRAAMVTLGRDSAVIFFFFISVTINADFLLYTPRVLRFYRSRFDNIIRLGARLRIQCLHSNCA